MSSRSSRVETWISLESPCSHEEGSADARGRRLAATPKMKPRAAISAEIRTLVARGFTLTEDLVYVGLGLLLGSSAVVLLFTSIVDFVRSVGAGSLPASIVSLLDKSLLVLLIVELLYTLQVSFREHKLLPEPFLLIGLISAIRRVLVVTAQLSEMKDSSPEMFHRFVIELGV